MSVNPVSKHPTTSYGIFHLVCDGGGLCQKQPRVRERERVKKKRNENKICIREETHKLQFCERENQKTEKPANTNENHKINAPWNAILETAECRTQTAYPIQLNHATPKKGIRFSAQRLRFRANGMNRRGIERESVSVPNGIICILISISFVSVDNGFMGNLGFDTAEHCKRMKQRSSEKKIQSADVYIAFVCVHIQHYQSSHSSVSTLPPRKRYTE